MPLYVIFLKSASRQHGSPPGSREVVLREHNLGSPGTQSRFSRNTILVLQESNLGSPGTQSQFSGNTIFVLREHNLGSPGSQSLFFVNKTLVLKEYNLCSQRTQSHPSIETIKVFQDPRCSSKLVQCQK